MFIGDLRTFWDSANRPIGRELAWSVNQRCQYDENCEERHRTHHTEYPNILRGFIQLRNGLKRADVLSGAEGGTPSGQPARTPALLRYREETLEDFV
jgi:hypothetical protein